MNRSEVIGAPSSTVTEAQRLQMRALMRRLAFAFGEMHSQEETYRGADSAADRAWRIVNGDPHPDDTDYDYANLAVDAAALAPDAGEDHASEPVSMCEGGCGPATTADREGVPLCAACAAALTEETLREVAELVGFDPDKHDDVTDAVRERLAPDAGTRGDGKDTEDAARYRWLKAQDPIALAAIAYRVPAATAHDEPDAAIDAARLAARTEGA